MLLTKTTPFHIPTNSMKMCSRSVSPHALQHLFHWFSLNKVSHCLVAVLNLLNLHNALLATCLPSLENCIVKSLAISGSSCFVEEEAILIEHSWGWGWNWWMPFTLLCSSCNWSLSSQDSVVWSQSIIGKLKSADFNRRWDSGTICRIRQIRLFQV